ncbi:MAG: hypothetical protein RBT80_23750 [Candidatus Vecturithrix sp.]|jgi:hypothetical protein|nr:hypothetical protein [Candidatus Vecturithrix sp.]
MYWLELKGALLYGQPQITNDMLQPEALKMAVREIARLVNFGWIDKLTDDALQRIQTACSLSHCPEIWDEFHYGNVQLLTRSREHALSC